MVFFKSAKTKIVSLIGIALVTSFLLAPMLEAQTSEDYLKIIAENTTDILKIVEYLPSQMETMTKMALSWLQKELPEQDSVASMQNNFSKISALVLENFNNHTTLQQTIVTELFDGITKDNLDYANDLVFQTLMGMPLFAEDPRKDKDKTDPKQNFFKFASGMKIHHYLPQSLEGEPGDRIRYENYYSTVMAIESYNAYLLSNLYEDFRVEDDPKQTDASQRTKSLTSLQNELLSQATSSTWFTQISEQELGLVLRQLLLFESQVYVLLTQLLQTQKQLVFAQAMGNTLQIASGIYDERNLLNLAQTKQKKSA